MSTIKVDNYLNLVNHYEATGQSFEIIDGDTLNFVHVKDLFGDCFESYQSEDLLVISVLGPQSSGKSLLMNFLFGT